MEFNLNRGSMPQLPPQAFLILMVPGVGMLVLGILILANPAITPYLLGGFLALVGALLSFLAWRLKQRLG